MKKNLSIVLSGMVIALAVMSCEQSNTWIIPSEKVTTTYLEISDYTELKVDDAITVEIYFSDTPQPIEIIANENLHPYIEIVKSSGVLNVMLQRDISVRGEAEMKVILHCEYLSGYTGNGASMIRLMDSLYAQSVYINLSGASKMEGIIVVESLISSLKDASLLHLNGQAEVLSLNLAGASRMTGFEFRCRDLTADFSDASSAELTVSGTIDIRATGASQLKYRGDAVITNQDIRDASSVVKDK